MEMHRLNGETRYGSEGGKGITQYASHGIGHHPTVGKATAVDTLAVNGKALVHILNDGQEKFGVFAGLTGCLPSRHTHAKLRVIHIEAGRIGHNETVLVCQTVEFRMACVTTATSTMQGQHQRGTLRHVVGHIQFVCTLLAIYLELNLPIVLGSQNILCKQQAQHHQC